MLFVSLDLAKPQPLKILLVACGVLGLALCPISAAWGAATTVPNASQPFSVTTYHYDEKRTGWNKSETVLTPDSVKSSLGLKTVVTLDDQVDAQPLYLPKQQIFENDELKGTFDTIYIATEANTIYAIDADTGNILTRTTLGTPVASSDLPAACDNNGPHVGINSTPVIYENKLFVLSYQKTDQSPKYFIYKLDPDSLKVEKKVEVTASQTLAHGQAVDFEAKYNRQRPALVATAGNIYAAFGSFCDIRFDVSRGWVIGWDSDLEALKNQQLNNSLNSPLDGTTYNSGTTARPFVTNPYSYFLTSVWMSGYGIAADDAGALYFTTGNSAKYVSTYGPPNNIQNSVVKLSNDLSSILSFFTPSDAATHGVTEMDRGDLDFGSGGVLVLPDQPLPIARLAAAMGKPGILYLLNRDNLGGHGVNLSDNVVFEHSFGAIDACFCGSSYFEGPDGVGRIVSSAMRSAIVWRLEKAGEGATLVQESASPEIPQPQPDGFFTSVSSNGNSDAVIWAISRPMSRAHPEVDLLAFDAKDASQVLFSRRAGTWPNTTGKANLVPAVADGRVLVASYRELDIFAPGGNHPEPAAQLALESFSAARINTGEKVISGVVDDVGKDRLTIIDRNSNKVQVEIPADFQSQTQIWQQSDTKGEAIKVTGVINPADGSVRAKSILRAPQSPGLWAPDQ